MRRNIPDLVRVALTDRLGSEEEGLALLHLVSVCIWRGVWRTIVVGMAGVGRTLLGAVPLVPLGTVIVRGCGGSNKVV